MKEPGEVSVDDPVDILRLAERLEGVSVDCPAIQSDNECKGDTSKKHSDKVNFICGSKSDAFSLISGLHHSI